MKSRSKPAPAKTVKAAPSSERNRGPRPKRKVLGSVDSTDPDIPITVVDEPLTEREMKFVEEFSTHFDGARAVRAAGYTASTDTAARHVASTLTARPRVQEALTRRRNAPAAELELSKSNIRKLLTHLLFLDPLDFMAPLPDGRWVVRDMTQVPPWARLAISYCKSTMRYSKDGSPILTSEIKWVDKGLLLQLAMKYKGMLGDREDNKSVHGPTAEFVAQMMNTKIPPTMVVQQHEIERRLTIVPSVVPREEIPDAPPQVDEGTDEATG